MDVSKTYREPQFIAMNFRLAFVMNWEQVLSSLQMHCPRLERISFHRDDGLYSKTRLRCYEHP